MNKKVDSFPRVEYCLLLVLVHDALFYSCWMASLTSTLLYPDNNKHQSSLLKMGVLFFSSTSHSLGPDMKKYRLRTGPERDAETLRLLKMLIPCYPHTAVPTHARCPASREQTEMAPSLAHSSVICGSEPNALATVHTWPSSWHMLNYYPVKMSPALLNNNYTKDSYYEICFHCNWVLNLALLYQTRALLLNYNPSPRKIKSEFLIHEERHKST